MAQKNQVVQHQHTTNDSKKTNLEPHEIYHRLFHDKIVFYSRFIGINIFNQDKRMNAIASVWIIIANLYIIASVYTIIAMDFSFKLKCLSLLGIPFQGLAKYYSYLRYGDDIKDCVTFLSDKIYLQYKDESPTKVKLAKLIKYTDIAFNFGLLSYFCSFSALMINPLILYKLTGVVELILPCFIPGIDSTTVIGYIITTIFEFACAFVGIVIMVCSDFGNMALLINALALIEVFGLKFDEVGDMMKKKDIYTEAQIKYAFRNLILMHLDIRKFFYIVINKILEVPNAFVFPFTSLTLVIDVYLIFVEHWLPGFFFFFGFLFQLFVFCVLGTIVELLNDRIYGIITDIDWLLLPMAERKMLIMLQSICQSRPSVLKLSGVYLINMDMFVSIMKSIYQVAMMILTFIVE